jgi:hypothetical protein
MIFHMSAGSCSLANNKPLQRVIPNVLIKQLVYSLLDAICLVILREWSHPPWGYDNAHSMATIQIFVLCTDNCDAAEGYR